MLRPWKTEYAVAMLEDRDEFSWHDTRLEAEQEAARLSESAGPVLVVMIERYGDERSDDGIWEHGEKTSDLGARRED